MVQLIYVYRQENLYHVHQPPQSAHTPLVAIYSILYCITTKRRHTEMLYIDYLLPSTLLYYSSRVSRIPSPRSAGLVRSIQVWSGQVWFDQVKPDLVWSGDIIFEYSSRHFFGRYEQNCKRARVYTIIYHK